MALLLIEAASTTAADSIETEARSGSLYGVNLGTTTKISSYSNFVLLDLTQARSLAVCDVLPRGVDSPMLSFEPSSFTQAEPDGKVWYLRGLLS